MTEAFPYPATVARVRAALAAAGLRRLVRYVGPCRDGVLLIAPGPPFARRPLPPVAAAAAALPGCHYDPALEFVHVSPGWVAPARG